MTKFQFDEIKGNRKAQNNTKIKKAKKQKQARRHVWWLFEKAQYVTKIGALFFELGNDDYVVHAFQLNRSNSLVIFCSTDGLSCVAP